MQMPRSRRLAALVLAATVTGCATVNYDPAAEQQISAVTQSIDTQFSAWEQQAANPATPVAYDDAFYAKTAADLAALQQRLQTGANASNAKTQQYFASLQQQIGSFRDFHKAHGNMSPEAFHAERLLLDPQLAELSTYEQSLSGSPH